MKPQLIQKKGEGMVGKSFEYAKQIHIVEGIEINDFKETFVLKTNLNTFCRKFESAKEFFKYWEQTDLMNTNNNKNQGQESDLPVQFVQENNLADELVILLKENIQKVKESAGYIPQAKAINNDVNSILHVQKLKLDMLKHMKNSRR